MMEGRIELAAAWLRAFGRAATPYALIAGAAFLFWCLR